MPSQYRPRIADRMLSDKLEGIGAVVIEGPKACGKTTTAAQQAKSTIFIDDPGNSGQYLQLADTDPERLLEGDVPRLIDEWQLAPKLWDAIRHVVDRRDADGQFILTGSAVPPDKSGIRHTGTGRFGWVRMRPMTLWESGESNGSVSLGNLFSPSPSVSSANSSTLDEVAYMICRGGWPRAITKTSERAALMQAEEYYDAVTRMDISRVDGVARDYINAGRLMRSYSRHQGSQASLSTIIADMRGNEGGEMSDTTISSYLSALRKIFVIEDMPAWNPNLRSRTAIRTSDTRYFVDPSIAAAALGLAPADLIRDLRTFGLLFETMCVRDLRVYADALRGHVYHYRDKNGLECDAVIHLRNGAYGLVEVKTGGDNLIEEGARTLLKLSGLIDTARQQPPAFLMVLTAVGPYAFRRRDGVFVVPITCLKS